MHGVWGTGSKLAGFGNLPSFLKVPPKKNAKGDTTDTTDTTDSDDNPNESKEFNQKVIFFKYLSGGCFSTIMNALIFYVLWV